MTTIRVTGTGRASSDPDFASFDIHVDALAQAASEANSEAQKKAAHAVKVLDDAGVDAEDRGVQHTNIHRRTRWNGDREVFVGWAAGAHITCSIREPEQAYDLVAQLADTQDLTINGPNWMIDPDNPAHHRARARAVHAATSKAQSYAEAAGLSLGELIELIEGGADSGIEPRMMRAAVSAESAAIDPASQQVVASVTLVFDTAPVRAGF